VVLFSLFFFNYIIEYFFFLPYHGLLLFYLLFILLSILFLFFCFSSESPILADVVCGHYAFLAGIWNIGSEYIIEGEIK
jgi:hypothetical protein